MTTDVLIVGSGLAGLYTALHIDPAKSVLIITKDKLEQSGSSWIAQGGIAAAISHEDTPELHVEDTLVAGAHLCNVEAVCVLCEEAPRDIEFLWSNGVPFDTDPEGELSVTREGGHSLNRVVHAGGDATGRETVHVLAPMVAAKPNVTIWDDTFLVDLITKDGAVTGATVLRGDKPATIHAGAVVLAAGGCGQIFSRTTNPSAAIGDSIAAAIRAGAKVADMEFIQFHPTALYNPAASADNVFLISEAVRGEGAMLVNADGERFMQDKHPLAELAPRDIVARAIDAECKRTGSPCVWLDLSPIPEDRIRERFPTILAHCAKIGIDITREKIPVAPCQHYLVGGIATDLTARTSLKNLYAVGENACTGVHGANRLASNSMLECLVFGRRAACAALAPQGKLNPVTSDQTKTAEAVCLVASEASSHLPDRGVRCVGDSTVWNQSIRNVCDSFAGVVRTTAGLDEGLRRLTALEETLSTDNTLSRPLCETKNMLEVAKAVFTAARNRTESIGTHYIADNNE